jgi:hypothetical protein
MQNIMVAGASGGRGCSPHGGQEVEHEDRKWVTRTGVGHEDRKWIMRTGSGS